MASTKKTAAKKPRATKADGAKATRLASLGVRIDQLGRMREKRKALEDAAGKVKSEETALGLVLMKELGKLQAEGASGRTFQVSRGHSDIVIVEDWAKFYGWIFKHKIEDALQHRPVVKSLQEHQTTRGESVPGIKFDAVAKLNLSRRKRA